MTRKIPKKLRIVEYKNAVIVKSQYPFGYESFDTPELKQLREKYRLSEVIAGKKSEFDKIVALRSWVHSQWGHGWSFKDQKPAVPTTNALRVLGAAKKGVEFHCGYYAYVFIQCLLSLGFQARLVGLCKDISHIPIPELQRETNIGHCVVEVWSNDFQKWIVMDPDINAHYEDDNSPLNALDIRKAWLAKRWKKVKLAQGNPLPSQITKPEKYTQEQHKAFKIFTQYKAIDYYHRVEVEMRNDWFSSKKGYFRLVWTDNQSPPNLVEDTHQAVHNTKWAQNINDLYWTLNQAHLHLSCSGKEKKPGSLLDVQLETVTPNFDKYLVKIDTGPWKKIKANFTWRLKKGGNTIYAKSVNKFGMEGVTSLITVNYK